MEYHQNCYARVLDEAALPGCRWLDLGAGARLHGGWIGPAAGEVTGRARWVIGCDLQVDHLRRHPQLTYRVGAVGERLPFPDASFDLVSANMVLEHLERPGEVFREIARVLVPGGVFVFVTPNRGHPAVTVLALLMHPRWRSWVVRWSDRRLPEHIFPTFYRANTRDTLGTLAGAAGLAPVKLETFCSFPIMHRYPILRSCERWWIACTETRWGAPWRSNLVGILRRLGGPAPGSPLPSGDSMLHTCR